MLAEPSLHCILYCPAAAWDGASQRNSTLYTPCTHSRDGARLCEVAGAPHLAHARSTDVVLAGYFHPVQARNMSALPVGNSHLHSAALQLNCNAAVTSHYCCESAVGNYGYSMGP